MMIWTSFFMLPLFFFAYIGIPAHHSSLAIIAYTLTLRLPHFISTYFIIASAERWKEWFLSQPLTRIWIPAFILIIYAVPFGQWNFRGVERILESVAYAWGFLHLAFQAYGIARRYQKKNNYKWLLRIPFLCLFVQMTLAQIALLNQPYAGTMPLT